MSDNLTGEQTVGLIDAYAPYNKSTFKIGTKFPLYCPSYCLEPRKELSLSYIEK